MAYTPSPETGFGDSPTTDKGKIDFSNPVVKQKKALSYSASVNTLILDITKTATEGSVQVSEIKALKVVNTGKIPAYAIFAYNLWTDSTTDSDSTYHVHYLLNPNDEIVLPTGGGLITDADVEPMGGTVVTDQAPDSNMYVAVDSQLIAEALDSGETGIDVDDGDFFRIGDFIQIETEIVQVTAISTNTLTVIRGAAGSSKASHSDDTALRFPFFNAYQNYGTYARSQTDSMGRFKSTNFFGLGRAATKLAGIQRGSVAFQFYEAGYQNLTKSGDITANTNSGLSTSQTYYLSIAIDGGSTDKITFTTDSSNVNFGGTGGISDKLQRAINNLYYNPAKNGFEKTATVSVVDGNLRVTSGQRLSSSAIAITTNTDGTSGTDELFDTSNAIGRFPATIPVAIPGWLDAGLEFDPVTYGSTYKDIFVYDDGRGNLFGNGVTGKINYESGAFHFTNAPPNANFVYSVIHTGAFAGKSDATDADKKNNLQAVYGNITSQKWAGELECIGI